MVWKKPLLVVLFIIGFLCCIFPTASSFIEGYYQRDAIATYQNNINSSNKEELEHDLKKAEEFNSLLFEYNNATTGNISFSFLDKLNYENILNRGNGVIGSIEIPKIGVNLPIYHGTEDDVLSVGIGHVYGSSFPIGGVGTRSILTGHRGLPNAQLFTRLDEIVEGDLFFIRVLNKILAYKVCDIEIIKPDEVDVVNAVQDKDLVSLITCTPYGLNTHRLVVTGERTEYEQAIYDNIESKGMSIREYIFLSIPFIFLVIIVGRRVKNARKKNKNNSINLSDDNFTN